MVAICTSTGLLLLLQGQCRQTTSNLTGPTELAMASDSHSLLPHTKHCWRNAPSDIAQADEANSPTRADLSEGIHATQDLRQANSGRTATFCRFDPAAIPEGCYCNTLSVALPHDSLLKLPSCHTSQNVAEQGSAMAIAIPDLSPCSSCPLAIQARMWQSRVLQWPSQIQI